GRGRPLALDPLARRALADRASAAVPAGATRGRRRGQSRVAPGRKRPGPADGPVAGRGLPRYPEAAPPWGILLPMAEKARRKRPSAARRSTSKTRPAGTASDAPATAAAAPPPVATV